MNQDEGSMRPLLDHIYLFLVPGIILRSFHRPWVAVKWLPMETLRNIIQTTAPGSWLLLRFRPRKVLLGFASCVATLAAVALLYFAFRDLASDLYISGRLARMVLIGNFSVTLLNPKHVLIKLVKDLDYNRVFSHHFYFVNSFMRLTKWSPFLMLMLNLPLSQFGCP
ncbi:hypothetical protein IEQ34_022524 [Dendrobium chrysotoxum]|uniref:Uncharacterized protein n=1 Tax=Dendrobium chrysotoxum TaxID=161865 RepID=A0AAV7FK67_DENCH|nr:hypothetical protein IEQ34_022524 [Dendrobium chrysotoxum]